MTTHREKINPVGRVLKIAGVIAILLAIATIGMHVFTWVRWGHWDLDPLGNYVKRGTLDGIAPDDLLRKILDCPIDVVLLGIAVICRSLARWCINTDLRYHDTVY